MLSNPTNRIVVGVVRWFTANDKGGYWHVTAPEGKFRIYPQQFTNPPTVGQIISFVPDPRSSGKLRKVSTVLFEPDAPQSSIEVKRNQHMDFTELHGKPVRTDVTFQPEPLCDAYYTRGKHFPIADEETPKGPENGPNNLVRQSDRQKDAGLNASGGLNGPSIRGEEGKSFSPAANSKDSEDESQTFAGDRDASVSVNLTTGQIVSSNESRLVPVPENRNDNKTRALVKFKRSKADAKENRL